LTVVRQALPQLEVLAEPASRVNSGDVYASDHPRVEGIARSSLNVQVAWLPSGFQIVDASRNHFHRCTPTMPIRRRQKAYIQSP